MVSWHVFAADTCTDTPLSRMRAALLPVLQLVLLSLPHVCYSCEFNKRTSFVWNINIRHDFDSQ